MSVHVKSGQESFCFINRRKEQLAIWVVPQEMIPLSQWKCKNFRWDRGFLFLRATGQGRSFTDIRRYHLRRNVNAET